MPTSTRTCAAQPLAREPIRVPPVEPDDVPLIWTAVPGGQSIADVDTIRIEILPGNDSAASIAKWLSSLHAAGLHELVYQEDDGEGAGGRVFVHQHLALMAEVRARRRTVSVTFWTWDRLHSELDTPRDVLPFMETGRPFVVFLVQTHVAMDVLPVYERIETRWTTLGTGVRVYPNRLELLQAHGKLGDIRQLDEIARGSEPEWTFRPRTCFPRGACALRREVRTVHKRNYSGSTEHVKLVPAGAGGSELTCLPESTGRKRKRRPQYAEDVCASWFHQEYMPSLEIVGEFRVFIVPSPDRTGLRGLRGKVVYALQTLTQTPLTPFQQRGCHFWIHDPAFEDPQLDGMSDAKLHDFALHIYEQLRKTGKSEYESLEVGVRLDIGVSPPSPVDGEKRLFANEISRWYEAHWLCGQASKYSDTKLWEVWAEAFGRWMRTVGASASSECRDENERCAGRSSVVSLLTAAARLEDEREAGACGEPKKDGTATVRALSVKEETRRNACASAQR
ncbi:hypothetical protein LTR53_010649 [Teratosphaeriaceae sp. CCFEE 6253]|nr:hypothetical protein LTR53_010649 [Teratosphaeriaceae sp. CCFEE 6253]